MRRLARGWLLWLALLLPIAQAMAGVHALSHVGDGRDDGIAHLVHCDLCLTAADLGAGAPAAQPALLDAHPAAHAAPWAATVGALRPADAGLPPARAPPASA
jgi:hypothetical protein